MTRPFRDAASFGKRQEFIAIAELLKRRFDVYATLVDDQQIDCVVRREVDGQPSYLDIQIKARSKDAVKKNAATFAAMEIRKPRKNFYFVFFSEHANCYWVIPSQDLVREATINKSGKNKGKYSIVLTNLSERTGKVSPRPRFERYRDNFDLLRA